MRHAGENPASLWWSPCNRKAGAGCEVTSPDHRFPASAGQPRRETHKQKPVERDDGRMGGRPYLFGLVMASTRVKKKESRVVEPEAT